MDSGPLAIKRMVKSFKSPLLDKNACFSHGFMTRQGGVSTGYFSSLNAGVFKEAERADDPDHVRENYQRIAAHLGGRADRLLTLRQIHSNHVIVVDGPWSEGTILNPNPKNRPEGDALVTQTPGLIIGVVTADCVPILLADPVSRTVGVIHAGWKGAISGIVRQTVAEMVRLGAQRHTLMAAIGPCIWQESYEVSPQFYEEFPFSKSYFAPGIEGHWYFDLPEFIYDQLEAETVLQISRSPIDTYANPELFFSFRRKTHLNEPLYGNGFSGIMIREEDGA